MSLEPTLKFTAADFDTFTATIVGVDLTGADYVRLRVEQEDGTVVTVAGSVTDATNGVVSFTFGASGLVKGPRQRAQIQWSLASVPLTSDDFFINVKRNL